MEKEWQPYKGHAREKKKKLNTFSDFLELWENATNFTDHQGRSTSCLFNIWNEAIHSCWMKYQVKKGWCDVHKIKTFLQSVGDYDIRNHMDFFFFFALAFAQRRWENEYTQVFTEKDLTAVGCVLCCGILSHQARKREDRLGPCASWIQGLWLLMSIEKNEMKT